MVFQNPPKLQPTKLKSSKIITPEQIAGKSEGSQQKALMVWAAQNFNIYPQLKYLFHIPNGGTRNVREAVELKAQGVKAGVPDLFLPAPVGLFAGAFIEMKVKPNLPTVEQTIWIGELRILGYYCKVCYSWIEARDCIVNYLERNYER